MIYPVALKTVGLVIGLLLILSHAFILWRSGDMQKSLRQFPRSRPAGTVLIILAVIWSFFLVLHMDLGEFSHLRRLMLGAIVAGGFLAWRYMEEFLAVRALGMLALLAAEPLLEAAFLRPEETRLLLVVLAYAWVIAGLFWVGMPWTLRDQITWVTKSPLRFQAAAGGGVVYGAAILVCAAFFWR